VIKKTGIFSALAIVAVILGSVAAAGGTAASQRVAITAKGGIHGFALRPPLWIGQNATSWRAESLVR